MKFLTWFGPWHSEGCCELIQTIRDAWPCWIFILAVLKNLISRNWQDSFCVLLFIIWLFFFLFFFRPKLAKKKLKFFVYDFRTHFYWVLAVCKRNRHMATTASRLSYPQPRGVLSGNCKRFERKKKGVEGVSTQSTTPDLRQTCTRFEKKGKTNNNCAMIGSIRKSPHYCGLSRPCHIVVFLFWNEWWSPFSVYHRFIVLEASKHYNELVWWDQSTVGGKYKSD